MEKNNKPKLVFFQYKHDESLAEFVLLHRQQHIRCLSECFEVIVINENCDYQQICDNYQPDLTLFESGVNYRRCRRLEIKNTHAHPEIPKLGFHNGDSWCEARAGFISDMEHWGIETFFSISTTTAEHTPEIADNLFVWPNFIDADIYRDYGESKIIPIMFTGFIHQMYPWRQKIYQILSPNYPSLTCPHSGYDERVKWRMLYGEQYARTINASWFVPTCGSVEKEVVRKHFEIPASKSCLITEKTPNIEAAGFVDMQNCVFADDSDVLDKLNYLFQNPDELESIINAGYQLVHSRHTLKQRDQIFQWLYLNKNLKPTQKIVQTNPFEPLIIVEKSSEIKNSQIISNGLIIQLLHQGDEKLWQGKYDDAQAFYLRCLNYVHWMPEPKLRLALCNLYKGNADAAISWILQPIKYTLEQYKAIDPDPVEWTYFIISLLCQGKLEQAIDSANQFPSLCHPELERIRLVIDILKNRDVNTLSCSESCKYRYSIHHLPSRSLNEWIDNLCVMLLACKQSHLVEKLKSCLANQSIKLNKRINITPQQETKKHGTSIKKIIQNLDPNHLVFEKWFKTKLRIFLLNPLNKLEKVFGYFLPYRFSERKNDVFFSTINKLINQESIKTVLVIGASAKEGSTEALLTGIHQNSNKPTVFCINRSGPKFITLQKRYANDSLVRCYCLQDFSHESLFEEIEKYIENIQRDHQIIGFDLVLIDASELAVRVKLEKLCKARFILLDDINILENYDNHHMLIEESRYRLVEQNLSLRQGYSIFKKVAERVTSDL